MTDKRKVSYSTRSKLSLPKDKKRVGRGTSVRSARRSGKLQLPKRKVRRVEMPSDKQQGQVAAMMSVSDKEWGERLKKKKAALKKLSMPGSKSKPTKGLSLPKKKK